MSLYRRISPGGYIPDAPMIITDGKARWEDFHYKFTTLGKVKKKRKDGTFPLELQAPKNVYPQLEKKFKYELPRNFCPDCGQTDRPVDPNQNAGGAINVITFEDPEPGLGLKPNDICITYKCQDCVLQCLWSGNNLAHCKADNGGFRELTEYERRQLANERMKRNTQEYMRCALLRGDGYRKIYDGD